VFQLKLEVPAGFEVRSVRGHAVKDSQAAAYESHQPAGADQTELLVNLSRKAIGKVGLLVELNQRLDDPNLLRPTGEKSMIDLDLPRIAPETIDQCTGRLVIYKPDSLRLVPSEQDGISDAVSLSEVYQNVPSARGDRFFTTKPPLTFAYTEQPAKLTLSAERRKPHLTARQLLLARIDTGVVRYEATFFYDILYSGVKSLRIDVPADLAAKITNATDDIEKDEFDPSQEPDAEPVADGYIAWRLTGDTELIGKLQIKFEWQEQIEGQLTVEQPLELPLPRLLPRDIDDDWGQIVIAKAETIDVGATGDPQGLRMIDPQQELMAGARVDDAALAFRFDDDSWQLKILAQRYELTEVKRTSIERAVVRMAATLDNELIVQALYRLRSARQRIEVELPGTDEDSFDSQPLWINGELATLERGEGDSFFVPLVGQDPDDALLLELRYSVRGGLGNLQLPVFPEEPAVQKVFLCAYVPRRLAVLGSRGPWTSEAAAPWQQFMGLRPGAHLPEVSAIISQMDDRLPMDEALIQSVMQGISVSGDPAEGFPTEGELLIYSTLRPADPPDGNLHLTTFNRTWLHVLLCAFVVVVGLALVSRPVREKTAAVLAAVIALLLCGVFLPTFTMQILSSTLAWAAILLLLFWLATSVLFGTYRGRSLLTALVSGRQPADVVVQTVTPPPPPPAPAATGVVQGEPPGAADAQQAEPPSSDASSDAEPASGETPDAAADAPSEPKKPDTAGGGGAIDATPAEESDRADAPSDKSQSSGSEGDEPEGGRDHA
jgi:hypothetical protein